MKTIETIAIANDHGGLALKLELLKLLQAAGYKVIDFGSGTDDAVDYPDYAELAVAAVQNGQADAGLLICGSGIGMSMAANRHKGIRAALCH
ncbi:MAG: RpiB/LacA/LacB family sugar-phosphate isomerase, partial [Defluviitaleaceae bacterium]|nr:RpiB/LacA/LacB family sugar-phosphate isomerase [Defluviitaleaceae bacterium]